MRLLDSAEAREVDRFVIGEIGLPSLVLMENAALAVAEVLEQRFPGARRVAVVCGGGNNGGDGLALARQLAARRLAVSVLLCARAADLALDAAAQHRALAGCGVAVEEVGEETLDRARERLARADVVVDALFGTGLTRPIAGWRAAMIEVMNSARAPRLAIDVPSGIDAGAPDAPGPQVRAQVTVTFFAPKRSLVLLPAAEAAGETWLAPLGVTAEVLERGSSDARLLAAVELVLPERAREGHKGTFGHLVVVAGSPGKSGAAVLAARGALRSGAGLVTVAAPEAIRAEVDAGCVEAMTLPLPAEPGVRLGTAAAGILAGFWEGKQAAALGPGLGDEPAIAAWIRDLVVDLGLSLALDADGINAFAGRATELRRRRAATVLTPHPGELARLLGRATPRGSVERFAAARDAAEATGCVIVLKGFQTLIATPGGPVHVNPSGNPGMATAGSGDVLTGALGAWLARGFDPLQAATNAVFLHGLAGDIAAARQGEDGMMAGDLAERLPEAFRRARAAQSRPRRGLAFAVGRTEVAELAGTSQRPPRVAR
ncbi:MAG TPA: NAD(P)H-hydrate dehydratase [Thermoanaerobaculia bacterium]|nr:NAD(P)H-hydrate dehydratase [Thermoanaerobaculia bacterium]